MADRHYRIIEKKDRHFLVDWDGNIISPEQAKQLGQSLIQTAQDKSYVYVGRRESDGLYKIGRTENVQRRQSELGIEIVHVIECPLYGNQAANVVEAALHRMFKRLEFHIADEWFDIDKPEIELLQMLCANPESTLKLTVDFPPAMDEITKLYDEMNCHSYSVIVAKVLNGQYQNHMMNYAIVYELRSAYYRCLKADNQAGAGHAIALLDFIVEWNTLQREKREQLESAKKRSLPGRPTIP